MGRLPNDGRGRLGGRSKGTKNKPQPTLMEWAEALLNKNRSNIERTLDDPGTPEAAAVLAGLMAFCSMKGQKVEAEKEL